MEKYLKEIFDKVKTEQKKQLPAICPRCGEPRMRSELPENSFSRYADVWICPVCGEDEALGEFLKKPPVSLTRWYTVRNEMKGKTFLDFLRDIKELECELIIGDSDMPATFVWDTDCHITPYGEEYYAPILGAPYKTLENGNIEISCDDYKLGEHFTLAAAGHIGNSEWERLFGTVGKEL